MSPALAHESPQVFGKYDLLEYLGGGMADVYRARDRVTGKTVAIKILKRELAANEQMKARFLDEARIAAPLEFRHIINVFDFGVVDDRPYMVMEFLRGQDLRSAIRNKAVGSLHEKLRIAMQIVEAIRYIHANGIVHRDIKPENIHIDTAGVVRLIDFGIAKSNVSSLKTQLGFAVGTLAYMAPEQLVGTSTKLQLMDVYAFGLVFSEILTGVRAVRGESEQQVCYRILNEKLDLEPLRAAGVPKPVIDLICRCTAKEPEERIQSFDNLHRELGQIITTMSAVTAVQTNATSPRTSRLSLRLWMCALIAVAGVGGIGWYALSKPKPAAIPTPPINRPNPSVVSYLSPTLQDPAGDMVLVPGGQFLFGKDKEPRTLPAFYIDRTEVTNQAYARYAAVKKTRAPSGKPENPVVNITVADARNFCGWAGKRLPTMYEWEKAARGTDGRDFPWGNQIEPWRANVADNRERPAGGVMPVVSFPEGQSVYGALNMAGNVWEFVSNTRPLTSGEMTALIYNGLKYKGNPAARWPILYGGSYRGDLASSTANAKSWDDAVAYPRDKGKDIGCRCAK